MTKNQKVRKPAPMELVVQHEYGEQHQIFIVDRLHQTMPAFRPRHRASVLIVIRFQWFVWRALAV